MSKFYTFAQNSDLWTEIHNFYVLKDKHNLFFVKLFVDSVLYKCP